MLQATS